MYFLRSPIIKNAGHFAGCGNDDNGDEDDDDDEADEDNDDGDDNDDVRFCQHTKHPNDQRDAIQIARKDLRMYQCMCGCIKQTCMLIWL